VILPEIFGLNDHIRSICDRYTEEGYFTIAPDLSWRIQPEAELGYDESGFLRARELAKS